MIMFAMRFIAFCYAVLRCGGGCSIQWECSGNPIFLPTNHPFIPGQAPSESRIHSVNVARGYVFFVTLFVPTVANGNQLEQCTLIMRMSMIPIQGFFG